MFDSLYLITPLCAGQTVNSTVSCSNAIIDDVSGLSDDNSELLKPPHQRKDDDSNKTNKLKGGK